MSTRSIRTSIPQTACDVCGRTLLRGERAETYLAGSDRHSVCELCTSRALHGGWVREGTLPDYGADDERGDRRRSLLGRRRPRRRPVEAEAGYEMPPVFDDAPPVDAAPPGEQPTSETPAIDPEPAPAEEPVADAAERPAAPDWPELPARSARVPRRRARRPRSARDGDRDAPRQRRHVRAVPTSIEHKIDAAVELFNGSEHPRTAAGISRSLGLPDVAVHPTSPVGAIVNVVLAWELCWYRYEVDLSAEVPSVRGCGQGYELAELSVLERDRNASSDEYGRLTVAGRPADA